MCDRGEPLEHLLRQCPVIGSRVPIVFVKDVGGVVRYGHVTLLEALRKHVFRGNEVVHYWDSVGGCYCRVTSTTTVVDMLGGSPEHVRVVVQPGGELCGQL
jgi:hypothetical protein